MADAFETPEDAARGDIPERYARALDVTASPSGRWAAVLLETNEPPAVELYQVNCECVEGLWHAGVGGNGAISFAVDDHWVETEWEFDEKRGWQLKVDWPEGT